LINNKTSDPRLSTLEPIANFFNITVEELIGKPNISSKFNTKSISSFKLSNLYSNYSQKKNEYLDRKFKFAVELDNDSMSPIFTNKDILIFKTNCDYENRDFVLIDISKQKNLIFRQLLIDGANMLLKPINKDFPIINMNENDNIIAILVKSVKDF